MNTAQVKIQEAYKKALAIKPKVGGYPYLAECLRQAGVKRYTYALPSCQAIYVTQAGNVVNQGKHLVNGTADVPVFNKEVFIMVLRTAQNGDSTFPEFLKSSWETGVISYEADLEKRKVTYFGAMGETYVEEYPEVKLSEEK